MNPEFEIKSNSPKALLIATGIFLLCSFLWFNKWPSLIITGGDAWGYYAYLPSFFIHHDLDNLKTSFEVKSKYFSNHHNNPENPLGVGEAIHIGHGKQVMKYTMGIALLNLPFFALGHLTALATEFPADGYSKPYLFFVQIGGLFYLLPAFFLLWQILRKEYSARAASISILTIAVATNLYFFAVYNTGMAHIYLFSLSAYLLYFVWKWLDVQSWQYIVVAGFLCGMITLIRPTEMICLFIPLLFGIAGYKDFISRLALFSKNYRQLLLGAAAFCLPILLQLFYWKWLTGQFLFYSYGDEGLDLSNPQILKGLFGFKNGWLIYSPVMIFALLGIFYSKRFRFLLLAFLGIHLYVTYSWHNVEYINGFGSRPMVNAYAVLALPMAAIFDRLLRIRLWNWVLLSLLAFFACLNVFQTYQFSKGIFWTQAMNGAYYWAIWGKTHVDYYDSIVFDTGESAPDTSHLTLVKTVFYDNFEDPGKEFLIDTAFVSGKQSYVLSPDRPYGPTISLPAEELAAFGGHYLKISAWCRSEIGFRSLEESVVLVASYERPKGKPVKWTSVSIENKLGDDSNSIFWGRRYVWGEIYFFSKIPKGLKPGDVFKTYFWNSKNGHILIDDFKVEVWSKQ